MQNQQKEIVCNCCGRVIRGREEADYTEYLHVEKNWGYFSGKDGQKQEFDVCETCYNAWIKSFQIPVTQKEITELL